VLETPVVTTVASARNVTKINGNGLGQATALNAVEEGH
jgi:hypothetical protein